MSLLTTILSEHNYQFVNILFCFAQSKIYVNIKSFRYFYLSLSINASPFCYIYRHCVIFCYIYRRFVIFIAFFVIFTAVLLFIAVSYMYLLYLPPFCYIYRCFVIFIAVLLYLSPFCYIHRGFIYLSVIFIAVFFCINMLLLMLFHL